MRKGFDPALIKAASSHVRTLDMEKEALISAIAPAARSFGQAFNRFDKRFSTVGMNPLRTTYQGARAAGSGVGAAALKGLREQASVLTAGGSEKALKAAVSSPKLVGGLLAAGTVVSAIPQMAARSAQGYDQIRNEYQRQGGY